MIAQESEEADKVKVVVSREEAIASAEAAKVKAIKVRGLARDARRCRTCAGRLPPAPAWCMMRVAASVQDQCGGPV